MAQSLRAALLGGLTGLTGLAPLPTLPAQGFAKGDTAHVDVSYRSPQASLATMRLQPGYSLELVAAEPMVQEPCLCVWDGNGRMYVAEMRTYMQDADGTDKFARRSRVVRLEDRDWDGVMDHQTVFADKLLLPRVVLPLGNKVIIGETNTLDLYAYEDTDGDGVADKKELWHKGGKRGGNLEHQPSGLIWSIDNWIYRTYGTYRIRLKDGKVIRENCPGAGQWGLTSDDEGKVIFCNGGGERGPEHFNTPPIYGRLGGVQAEGFRTVYPIDNVPDVQGGHRRLRDDNTLNHFTATCGQAVYRAKRLPRDFWGNLVFCEPVGRLIRRSIVEEKLGETHIRNAYEGAEFLASTDANFRPINSATGPDGGLYLVDMYRGIIQEGNWVRKGSYLRKVVDATGLAANVMRGRIWRVKHQDYERNPTRPQMLDKKPAALIPNLSHENGWWRDTAQTLIILADDKSPAVVNPLKELARSGASALGRLHALWTLEGLGILDEKLIREKLDDPSIPVQRGALRLAEELIRQGDFELLDTVLALETRKDPQFLKQLALTISRSIYADIPHSLERIQKRHEKLTGVTALCDRLIEQHRKRLEAIAKKKRLKEEARLNLISFNKGQALYETLCHSCHGKDGRAPVVNNQKMAADFQGSTRLRYSHPDSLIKTVLHGLTGEVAGQKHIGVMVPMNSYDDENVAGVLNYVRNSFGNKLGYLDAERVAAVRATTKGRKRPYTERELLHEAPGYEDILAAMPDRAAPAKQPRRLLVFSDARGRSGPVPRGILALEAMSAKTGAFTVVFSDRIADLQAKNLGSFDAVFLNNTGGIEKALNTKTLRRGLIEFVRNGGGLAAIHGAAEGGWKQFTDMLGARGRGQPWRGKKKHGVRVEDPGHPVLTGIGSKDFKIRDELYRFHDFEREQVRVLLSVNLAVSKHNNGRNDRDNPLAWIKAYGKGRVFYSAFGRRASVFENSRVLAHWLAGVQYALGDLEATATPLPQPERR